MGGEAPRQRAAIGGNRRLGKIDFPTVEKDNDALRKAANEDARVPRDAAHLIRDDLGVGGTGAHYWGRPEQVMDIAYSVHRFCREATKFSGKYNSRRASPSS